MFQTLLADGRAFKVRFQHQAVGRPRRCPCCKVRHLPPPRIRHLTTCYLEEHKGGTVTRRTAQVTRHPDDPLDRATGRRRALDAALLALGEPERFRLDRADRQLVWAAYYVRESVPACDIPDGAQIGRLIAFHPPAGIFKPGAVRVCALLGREASETDDYVVLRDGTILTLAQALGHQPEPEEQTIGGAFLGALLAHAPSDPPTPPPPAVPQPHAYRPHNFGDDGVCYHAASLEAFVSGATCGKPAGADIHRVDAAPAGPTMADPPPPPAEEVASFVDDDVPF